MSRRRTRQASHPTNIGNCPSQRTKQHHKPNRKQRHKLMAPTVAFTVGLSGANALAQEKEVLTAPPVEVREQRPGYIVPNLGLSKFPEPIRDIPQTINVVPEELMQEQGVTTSAGRATECDWDQFSGGGGGRCPGK